MCAVGCSYCGGSQAVCDICLCVDLRALNKSVIVDHSTLPNITEMMTMLNGVKHFPTLDLPTAFHQIKLHEDSRDLTTFITLC